MVSFTPQPRYALSNNPNTHSKEEWAKGWSEISAGNLLSLSAQE
jgi:hypothetical protein